MGRVEQHQLQELAGGLGGEDRTAVTGGHQAWQQAAVVEMGVGEHHGIEAVGVVGKGGTIAFLCLLVTLAHAAFEQHLGAVAGFDQVAGAGYLLGRTEKAEQGHISSAKLCVCTDCATAVARS